MDCSGLFGHNIIVPVSLSFPCFVPPTLSCMRTKRPGSKLRGRAGLLVSLILCLGIRSAWCIHSCQRIAPTCDPSASMPCEHSQRDLLEQKSTYSIHSLPTPVDPPHTALVVVRSGRLRGFHIRLCYVSTPAQKLVWRAATWLVCALSQGFRTTPPLSVAPTNGPRACVLRFLVVFGRFVREAGSFKT